MKKIIAIVLAVIMMFSVTAAPHAVGTDASTASPTLTFSNYRDYLEPILEGENFFVQLIARLVIIGVLLGIVDEDYFNRLFDDTTPDNNTSTDTDTGADSDTGADTDNNTPDINDDNTSTDWEDGTELMLHPSQSLPIADPDGTITSLKVTKEHYDGLWENNYGRPVPQMYRYKIEIEGTVTDTFDGGYLELQYYSTTNLKLEDTRWYNINDYKYSNIDCKVTYNSDTKTFYCVCYQYNMFEDFDSFYIAEASLYGNSGSSSSGSCNDCCNTEDLYAFEDIL